MGRDLWETPELKVHERGGVAERFFDDGTFPDTKQSLDAAKEAMKLGDQRAAAFQHRTPPYAHLTVHEYGDRITQWLDAVELEQEPPTKQQHTILPYHWSHATTFNRKQHSSFF